MSSLAERATGQALTLPETRERAWARLSVLARLLAMGAALLTTAAVLAQASPAPQARPLAADPALEERVLKVAAELRCLVCQNETIAASHADLAKDLRDQVRDQLRAGRSEREILDYMVARYGDFVLYTPPVKPSTWLLWGGPFALLLVTLAALAFRVKNRRKQGAAEPLSAAELRRVRSLLEHADS